MTPSPSSFSIAIAKLWLPPESLNGLKRTVERPRMLFLRRFSIWPISVSILFFDFCRLSKSWTSAISTSSRSAAFFPAMSFFIRISLRIAHTKSASARIVKAYIIMLVLIIIEGNYTVNAPKIQIIMVKNRNKTIYLDHAASAPLDAQVFSIMKKILEGSGANPSALHKEGIEAKKLINQAIEKVAGILGAQK